MANFFPVLTNLLDQIRKGREREAAAKQPRHPDRWRHMQGRAGIENTATGEELSYADAHARGLLPLPKDTK